MNSKTTGIWFLLAAILFGCIFIFQHYFRPPVNVPQAILSGLRPSSVSSVQIIPSNALEIRADRTNDSWLLTEPVFYPAQPAAIETLLDALQKLTPATKISAAELREHKNSEAEFGFENPQFSLVIIAGDQTWQLKVGNKTAPGDQVFLRVVGSEGASVANADWLKFLPHSADEWRSTALVTAGENNFDSILLTNGMKGLTIELRRDPTNHLWRMIRPLPTRANGDLLADTLQRLQTARVSQFVTDDPKADLTAFGLQPANLDLWLGQGTNFIAAIHVGKSLTNDSSQVYARREGWNGIFTTAKEPLAAWFGAVNDFRDPHLLELTAPVAEIEVGAGTNHFTLQRQGSNDWRVVGEKFPADTENVQAFIKLLAGLRISEFVKDVVTTPDLAAYGLDAPTHRIILRSSIVDSNAVIAALSFSAQTNGVFVHRDGEDFIYSISPEDYKNLFGGGSLFQAGWQFRDRHIWSFSEKDVAQITLQQNGKTQTMIHNGANKWSLAANSQGIINTLALEETAHRLGEMTAAGWISRNGVMPGFNTNNLVITIQLKNGEKLSVDFGLELPMAHTALAETTLDGERWVFVFPPVLYQFVLSYLIIPANVP
jgi:hypothetical protein